jgi:hypothetical protein
MLYTMNCPSLNFIVAVELYQSREVNAIISDGGSTLFA